MKSEAINLVSRSIDILKPQFEKIEYLESIGFEFYELESSKGKPFGWRKGNVRITYNEFILHSLDSLKTRFGN